MQPDPVGRPSRPAPRGRRSRRWYGVGAALSGVVTILFATVGDGVAVPQAEGLRRIIVDHAHTLTWLLLTVAFGLAAVRGSWSRHSQWLAVAAGGCYLVFLANVFVLY